MLMFIHLHYKYPMCLQPSLKIIMTSHLFSIVNHVNNYFIIINLIQLINLIKLINQNKYVQMVIYT